MRSRHAVHQLRLEAMYIANWTVNTFRRGLSISFSEPLSGRKYHNKRFSETDKNNPAVQKYSLQVLHRSWPRANSGAVARDEFFFRVSNETRETERMGRAREEAFEFKHSTNVYSVPKDFVLAVASRRRGLVCGGSHSAESRSVRRA